ncbi:hypothetical protein SMACR_09997 [Sordaria macrospora]|uniref:WGS project CABT00000000 data, contig 2.299 n=2 Tax=Sordaria macrospora TaxID=5147 RepID=F7WCV6_SORMK|nr:uncharacterized protein SMAC_09997 [Sordaria macrospora k-hell]KAA8620668.1 hypothetical protein SMACR_09997 [Sordaria macrospora]WPJ63826.1 hypothetical protein SMAC4_09997 [Sordaria macrospora]CCC05721.1 unnamed protein product [Sordaria macrospora k-hell]
MIANSVDLPFLFHISPSGKSPCSFATRATRSATIASKTFPTQLKSAMGRHAPAIFCCAAVFPGFIRTTTFACRHRGGNEPRVKILVAITTSASTSASRTP